MEISTHAIRYNPCLRVFGIYELAKSICAFASRQDNANLSCVSSQLFQHIHPFVWERTDAVETIVQMIPETHVNVYSEDPLPPYIVVHLPRSLDLSRLGVYAPFIKYLDIPLTILNAYENWDDFLASTRSIDLLPNLEHLRLALPPATREESISTESLNWVTAFLSSSLLSLQIYPDLGWDADMAEFTHAWIDLGPTAKLLQEVSNKCRNLASLMILSGDVIMKQGIIDEHPRLGIITGLVCRSATFQSPHLRPQLTHTCFRFLRELSTSPFILDPDAFRALSKLPCLESLSIRGLYIRGDDRDPEGHYFQLDFDLTESSFPALRYLDLLDLNYDTTVNICKHKILAQALRRVRPTGSISMRNKVSQLLDVLANHDSSVRHMLICWILPSWRILSPSFEHLSSLSRITHLSIPQPDGNLFDLGELLRAVPSLEWLEMKPWSASHRPKLDALQVIATLLPNLKYVSGSIDFSSASLLGEQDLTSRAPRFLQPLSLGLIFDEESSWDSPVRREPTNLARYTERIARYLHALWPNIKCKAKWLYTSGDFEDPPELVQLNAHLSQLRDQTGEF